MSRGRPERTAERREEIMNACAKLYETMNFRDITLKEIGAETSISRPSIYNYFESREEIFLALFEREYGLWAEELRRLRVDAVPGNRRLLAEGVAGSLEKRMLLLKLLSVNLYDMEENSRLGRLVSFKKAYGSAREELSSLFQAYFPKLDEKEVRSLLYTFLQLMHGIYPYAHATEKQIEAMEEAGIEHPAMTAGEITEAALLRMLPVVC